MREKKFANESPTHLNCSLRGPKKCQQIIMISLLMLLLPAGATWAQTILIDLGDNFSDMAAQNWNTVQFTQSVADLIDDTGASTGISFAPLFWGGDFQNSDNWIEDTDWVLKEAATDHFGGFSNSTITFGNLDGLYKLEVVSAHPQTDHLTDITVNDTFADGNFQNLPGVDGDDFDPDTDGRDAKNFLIWDPVVPINGEIVLRVIKLAGSNAISVSALRLTRVGDIQASEIMLTATAKSATVSEPSDQVGFTARIDNIDAGSVEITSLTDDVYGDLNGQGDCSMPTTIAEGAFYSCDFTGTVTGNAGSSPMNTISASGSGQFNAVFDQDTATVDVTDVLPAALTLKSTFCQNFIGEPGGSVVFNVKVINNSVEAIDVTDLFDDHHGDLNGQGDCSVPQTLPIGGSYSCTYTATFNGVGGDTQTSTLTTTFEDDEANIDSADGSITVSIETTGSLVFTDCFESGDVAGWSELVVDP